MSYILSFYNLFIVTYITILFKIYYKTIFISKIAAYKLVCIRHIVYNVIIELILQITCTKNN